jgi:hypothetical protein
MANEDSIRFTLSDNTRVVVKKVTNNKYDFELTLPNGNRKTFIWLGNGVYDFSNRKGSKDGIVEEAIKMFIELNKRI